MLNQEELNQIKSRLELDKKELKSGIKAKIKNLFLDTNELTELADHSREEMNFLDKVAFGFRDANQLRKVRGALKKIEDGSYGECVECGEVIRSSRLLANPTSTKCIYCQEDEERTNKGFALPVYNDLRLSV